MGGGKSPPPAPDYTPFIIASQRAQASDAAAGEKMFQLGEDQLAAQNKYADLANQRGDAYYNLARQQQEWGMQQFNNVWPYAQQYLNSQQSLNTLAGKNAQEALDTAAQQRQQAAETYQRYMRTFAPMEDQFAATALNYNTPARADAAAAAAKGDVATAFAGVADANRAALRSYGIDPSQSRYAGMDAVLAAQRAAASAAAGTTARRQQEQVGLSLQQAAIEVGQKLPPTAIAQLGAGTTASSAGLAYGSVGGAGITGANQTIAGGVNAMGSPTAYASLSNPYTALSGSYGSLAGSMFGGGVTAYGNQAGAIGAGAGALNSSFQNQMASYQAQVQQQQNLWGGVGKLVGGIGSIAMAPFTGGASLLYNVPGTGGLY